MKTLTLLLATVACSIAAVPASAQSDSPTTVTRSRQVDEPDTIRVPYGDLSLVNASAADALRARVKQAAQRSCGNFYYSWALMSRRWACEAIVWKVAEPQIAAAIARAGAGQSLAAGAVVVRFAQQ